MVYYLAALTALLAAWAGVLTNIVIRLRDRVKDTKAVFAGQITEQIKETEILKERVGALEKKLEEIDTDSENGERLRHGALLRELNDEMEKGLRMEQQWNSGMASILGYSLSTATEGMKNE